MNRRDGRSTAAASSALGGGAFICTLAGQEVGADEGQIDVDGPRQARSRCRRRWRRRTANGERAPGDAADRARRLHRSGPTREYWIAAEPVEWDIVPTHRDQMMAKPVKGKTKFTAYGYRAYAPDFKEPLGAGDGAGAADRSRGRRHASSSTSATS